ncbi:MAG: MerR family transcriptional regulator [Flavobacterium sp.]
MNRLSIAQLAQFSGIKPHTIRIWEQRYNALSPERTEGNTRTYSGNDLRRLLNIVGLLDSKYKVSDLCVMSDDNLQELIQQHYTDNGDSDSQKYVLQLIAAGIEFNQLEFEIILNFCIEKLGLAATFKEVIYPLLQRLGMMWAADLMPPAQEHFMSNIVRQKLLVALDSLPQPKENAKKWLLFLAEDEFHEIALLFAHYILRQRGENVIYLGTNVPLNTLQQATDAIMPDALLTFFVKSNFPEDQQLYLNSVRNCFPKGNIYISGNERLISTLNLDSETNWLRNIDDL